MRAALAVPAGIGLVLLAFGVGFSVPDDDLIEAPFATKGYIGDELVSVHHVVTVHEVSLAREVELNFWEGTTAGVWLVVEATISARTERVNIDADVFLDGAEYPSTGRADSDILSERVADAGFLQTGSILIELPADALERPGATSAVLRIGPSGDTRLDSVVELRLDLTALELHERLELDPPRDGAR